MADQSPNTPAPVPQDRVAPSYDRNGRLTLSGMRVKHAAGYSVIHNGTVIPPGSPLPSEGELAAAGGDPADLDRVQQENEAEIERLKAENKRLKAKALAGDATASQQPAPPPQAPASPAPAKAPGK